jgi:ring-1,2-phenylacetyl-CoA epoxidase subunit PaaC
MSLPNERSAEAEQAVRDLLASLVKSKQFLGFQYASWCAQGPSIESNIALAGMAQEEIGHSTVLSGLLGEPAADKDAMVTWAGWAETAGAMIDAWPKMIVTCLARDASATATLEVLKSSSDPRLAQRARKMTQEEQFHLTFGVETVRSFADLAPASRASLAEDFRREFDRAESELGSPQALSRLMDLGVLPKGAAEARARFLEGVTQQVEMTWG